MTLSSSTTVSPTDRTGADERADLLEVLNTHRNFLRYTLRDLTDEQARERTTVSQLCLGGLIKHVTAVESMWMNFVEGGPEAMYAGQGGEGEWADAFRLLPDETVDGVLTRYAEVAARTDALVTALPDLDVAQPLPAAPWFAPGARWSARRVLLHIVAETAQHAGHADIIRESLDGAKTMG